MTDSEVNWNERADMRPKATYSAVGSRPIRSPDELVQRLAAEDGADALGDRQLDSEAAREVAQHRRGRQALDDHPDLAPRLLRLRSLRDQLARAPVAARLRPAGDDEVAHAREPGERLVLAARAPRRAAPSRRGRA